MNVFLLIVACVVAAFLLTIVIFTYNELVDTEEDSVPTRQMLGFVRLITFGLIVELAAVILLYNH